MKTTIIVGSGMAGLMAARVLVEHYDEVWIVERDDIPNGPSNRPGVPQAHHPHRLTPRGRIVLAKLFPGLDEELLANGAYPTQGKESVFFNDHGSIRLQNPVNDASCSRALLECTIRQRVQQMRQVRFLYNTSAAELKMDVDTGRITGIIAKDSRKQSFVKNGDLVVYAGGYASKLVQGLENLGYEVPMVERLHTQLSYSTRRYSVSPSLLEKWDTIRIDGSPGSRKHTCVISFIENQTMEVILWNIGGIYPPTDPEMFERELAEITNPLLTELLANARPLSSPRGFRMPSVYRHRFEQMPHWPKGLFVIGDALCSLDPLHGLGITSAAIQTEVLQNVLAEQRKNPKAAIEKRFLQKVQHAVEPAWWTNAVSDLRWPGVSYTYPTPLEGLRLAQVFMDEIVRIATTHQRHELFGLYWLVQSAWLSPHELINKKMLGMLLAAGSADALSEALGNVEEAMKAWGENECPEIPAFSEAIFVPIEAMTTQG